MLGTFREFVITLVVCSSLSAVVSSRDTKTGGRSFLHLAIVRNQENVWVLFFICTVAHLSCQSSFWSFQVSVVCDLSQIRLRGSATLGAPKNHYVYQKVKKHVYTFRLFSRSIEITYVWFLLSAQPCLPVYVSELKLAFSLAMAIQFGSGVFWVRNLLNHIIQTQQDEPALIWSVVFRPLSPDGFTSHEHQANGPDQKNTGVHGSSPFKQIYSWCLLAT